MKMYNLAWVINTLTWLIELDESCKKRGLSMFGDILSSLDAQEAFEEPLTQDSPNPKLFIFSGQKGEGSITQILSNFELTNRSRYAIRKHKSIWRNIVFKQW